MCGRFTLTRSAADVAAWFGVEASAAQGPALTGRFNVAPTQPILVARRDPEQATLRLEPRVWGLVPPWADDPAEGARMINARAETAATRPAFRRALAKRRCLVPADGFYEWSGPAGRRVPQHVTLPEGALFAMAGLFEHWRGPGDREVASVTLLTTEANAALSSLHDRMPLLVDREGFDAWLDPAEQDGEVALERVPSSGASAFRYRPASVRVNDVRQEGPDCLVAEPDPQLSLF